MINDSIKAKVLEKLDDGTVVSVIDDFLSGHCHEFAIALHRTLGYKMGVIKSTYVEKETGDKKYVLLHAFGIDAGGQAYDIEGKYSIENAMSGYNNTPHPDTGEPLEKISYNVYSDEKTFRKKLWTIPVKNDWIQKGIKKIAQNTLFYSRGDKSVKFNNPKPYEFLKILEMSEKTFPMYNPEQDYSFENEFSRKYPKDEYEKKIFNKIKKIKTKNNWKINSDYMNLRFPYINDSYEKNKQSGSLTLIVSLGNKEHNVKFANFKIKLNNGLSDKKSFDNFNSFISELGDFVLEKGPEFLDKVVKEPKKGSIMNRRKIIAKVIEKLAPGRPPKKFLSEMKKKLKKQYPKYDDKQLTTIAAGIWHKYDIDTKVELTKKYEAKTADEDVAQMVKKHDWYYEMSDDQSKYMKGRAELKAIANKLKEMDLKEAVKLWNDNCPKDFKSDEKKMETFFKIYAK